MEETYFLGANSRAGFASLYRHFCSAPGDTLHVIKGGPGTGKSSFMGAIAAAARSRGLDVETVLCSGDPASLDGVYIPALKQGWVDGTAPHVLDPGRFGADGDYVDLGRFCRLPLPEAAQAEIGRLTEAYRERYAAAYRWLNAAGALDEAARPSLPPEAEQRLRRRLRGILQRGTARGEEGRESARFLSAISCAGRLRLPLTERCRTVYRVAGETGPQLLRIAAGEAAARGLDRVLCPSPLDPSVPEALLLPGSGLAFVSGGARQRGERGLHPDVLLPPDAEAKQKRRRAQKLREAALDEALEELRLAKALHDELEAVYRPFMDFTALTAFTEETVKKLL